MLACMYVNKQCVEVCVHMLVRFLFEVAYYHKQMSHVIEPCP